MKGLGHGGYTYSLKFSTAPAFTNKVLKSKGKEKGCLTAKCLFNGELALLAAELAFLSRVKTLKIKTNQNKINTEHHSHTDFFFSYAEMRT